MLKIRNQKSHLSFIFKNLSKSCTVSSSLKLGAPTLWAGTLCESECYWIREVPWYPPLPTQILHWLWISTYFIVVLCEITSHLWLCRVDNSSTGNGDENMGDDWHTHLYTLKKPEIPVVLRYITSDLLCIVFLYSPYTAWSFSPGIHKICPRRSCWKVAEWLAVLGLPQHYQNYIWLPITRDLWLVSFLVLALCVVF